MNSLQRSEQTFSYYLLTELRGTLGPDSASVGFSGERGAGAGGVGGEWRDSD